MRAEIFRFVWNVRGGGTHRDAAEVMRMQFKTPYIPPMEDCRMVVRTGEAVCYIIDTCCRDMTDGQRAEIEGKIVQLCRQVALRKISKRHPDE